MENISLISYIDLKGSQNSSSYFIDMKLKNRVNQSCKASKTALIPIDKSEGSVLAEVPLQRTALGYIQLCLWDESRYNEMKVDVITWNVIHMEKIFTDYSPCSSYAALVLHRGSSQSDPSPPALFQSYALL